MNPGQAKVRRRPLCISPQSLAERLFGILVPFHALVEHSELFVVVREVWLNAYIFEKLRHRAFVIVRPHGRHSEIKMDEGEAGIGPLGALELSEGSLRFFPVEIGFAKDQVTLCY